MLDLLVNGTLQTCWRAQANTRLCAGSDPARAFLDVLVRRIPFSVRGLQIDGGSEFRREFEAACAACRLRGAPAEPEAASYVERAQRTHREEFYKVWEVDPNLNAHRAQLQAWAEIYDTVRPHQHLNYLTPLEYCERYHGGRGKVYGMP